jgi:hypothetical protein
MSLCWDMGFGKVHHPFVILSGSKDLQVACASQLLGVSDQRERTSSTRRRRYRLDGQSRNIGHVRGLA